jgi:tRNA-2-methylthio-N6-dimethylallyladenosine synthase
MTTPRRFFIETWGCQMNELDSQRLAGQLMQQGVLPTRRPEDADLILLNSCSVREKAEQKVYSRLGEYRLLKEERPGLVIGLCGCVAQQEGERALSRVPDLDFVLGTARVGELRAVLRRRAAGERVVATGFPEHREFDLDAVARDGSHKGMVTIIEGCDKNCTFCIVPTTRGPERCRPLSEVLREVRHLVDYGFAEVELLGQTVNHWREPGGSLDFADLLDAVATVPGVRRLRFVTSYPRDFTARMIEQVARHSNICPYLHLPVQSGSDRVLRRMGRGYTRAEYLTLIADLRRARSGLAISTDVIVGFPGETEEDFQASLSLLSEARFAVVFAFKYSPRPGTAALRLGDEVSDEVASRRLQELFAVQDEIQKQLNTELVGETHEVLVTGFGREPGTLAGRTSCHRIVHFPVGDRAPHAGSLVRVRIDRAHAHSLSGSLAIAS